MQLLTPITKIMSLLPPSQTTNAALTSATQQLANHLASCAAIANRMPAIVMRINDDDLASWLNSRPPEVTAQIFAAHDATGQSINSAAEVLRQTLAASDIPANIPQVDTRPVAEKLADSRRVLAFEDGAYSVTTLPPEPEPEPEPEP
jgi:hypothetical protein